MSKKSTLTINDAFDLFIRKCKIKNLTDLSISSYEKKMVHFYEFIDKNEPITTVTKDTVDDYILWLRENTKANDITINSYLRSVRAFLYYCMECNYIPIRPESLNAIQCPIGLLDYSSPEAFSVRQGQGRQRRCEASFTYTGNFGIIQTTIQ